MKSKNEHAPETIGASAGEPMTVLNIAKAKLKECRILVETAKNTARAGKREIKSLKKQIKQVKKKDIYQGKKLKKNKKIKAIATEGL